MSIAANRSLQCVGINPFWGFWRNTIFFAQFILIHFYFSFLSVNIWQYYHSLQRSLQVPGPIYLEPFSRAPESFTGSWEVVMARMHISCQSGWLWACCPQVCQAKVFWAWIQIRNGQGRCGFGMVFSCVIYRCLLCFQWNRSDFSTNDKCERYNSKIGERCLWSFVCKIEFPKNWKTKNRTLLGREGFHSAISAATKVQDGCMCVIFLHSEHYHSGVPSIVQLFKIF
jgi:hypothetical protein